jgi:cytochrome b
LTKTGTAKAGKSKGDRPLSTGAIVIAALALLLLLGCIAWALARRRAFEPHWLLSLRHAMAEAGFRASATWSEFADWARLGR